ncbi:Uu.00g011100.m01.CDS01 [Anthostomella pinea]|uniref:Uu.00g011100.m01.CDS01 n=1 Tax=Anthostomella pinea TaxID=933095 RepID=A0AAI8VXP8_9PEZI|nr:Uu.00g011100.m01.CDS01 [Anthostomella pinea]
MKVVGLVASSITLVEVAARLGAGALKLRELWQQVHDVPETITRLLQEIEILEPVLEQIANEGGNHHSASDTFRLIFDVSTTADGHEYQARLQLPWWLVTWAFDIQASKELAGWKYTLRLWRTISRNSEVFNAAFLGRVDELRNMLIRHEASLYDRDPHGTTLLHSAAFGGQLELMESLRAWGLRGLWSEQAASLDDALTPLHYFVLGIKPISVRMDEKHKFLLEHGAYEADGPLSGSIRLQGKFYTHLKQNMRRSSDVFRLLQPIMFPDFYDRCIHERLAVFFLEDETDYMEREKEPNQESIKKTKGRHGIRTYSPMAEARRLVRDVVPLLDHLSSVAPQRHYRHAPRTALINLIMRWSRGNRDYWPLEYVEDVRFHTRLTPSDVRKRLRDTLACWLEDLRACGVDLEAYGCTENRIFREHWCVRYIPYCVGTTVDHTARLQDFDYGPNPEDWKFHWGPDAERFAGDFWEMVNRPPPVMPGSWIEMDE